MFKIMLMILLGVPGVLTAQTIQTVRSPTPCGDSGAQLDVLAQTTKPEALIIVIARQGTGDRSRQFNLRRLHNVQVYLTEYSHDSAKKLKSQVILAEGARVAGLGRIELYRAGELFSVIYLRANSDLGVGTCYPEKEGESACSQESVKNFYPCRDWQLRKRTPRR